jgi:hypothetical protein
MMLKVIKPGQKVGDTDTDGEGTGEEEMDSSDEERRWDKDLGR